MTERSDVESDPMLIDIPEELEGVQIRLRPLRPGEGELFWEAIPDAQKDDSRLEVSPLERVLMLLHEYDFWIGIDELQVGLYLGNICCNTSLKDTSGEG